MESLLTAIAKTFLAAWYLMLGVGIAHAHLLDALHPIGYWTAFTLDLTLGSVIFIESRASGSFE